METIIKFNLNVREGLCKYERFALSPYSHFCSDSGNYHIPLAPPHRTSHSGHKVSLRGLRLLCSHFGLLYRNLDHRVTNDVYGSGRTFSGIATRFIQYPTTYITFDFSNSSDADVRQGTTHNHSTQRSRPGPLAARMSTLT